jgi:hypothetical protein
MTVSHSTTFISEEIVLFFIITEKIKTQIFLCHTAFVKSEEGVFIFLYVYHSQSQYEINLCSYLICRLLRLATYTLVLV